MKILILALSGIGDALMFTPALQELRKQLPNARIDALVMYSGVKDIYSRTNFLDNIYHYNFLNSTYFSALKFISQFIGEYDISINIYPSNRKEYNVISFIIGAKNRYAIKYLRRDFLSLGFLNNQRVSEDDSLHNVEENYNLIQLLLNKSLTEQGSLIFNLTQEDVDYANNFYDEQKFSSDDLLIGFHPGCSTLKNHANRRWSAENFGKLAEKLSQNHNVKILVFGGKDETELKIQVFENSSKENIFLVNTENLAQTAAIMKRLKVFISNDSSLMHVAAAMQLKVVAILGPTNKNYIHPWKTEFRIASLDLDCSPCFHHSPKPLTCIRKDKKFKCVRDLSVDLVYQRVLELL